jgi:hypothetical protein
MIDTKINHCKAGALTLFPCRRDCMNCEANKTRHCEQRQQKRPNKPAVTKTKNLTSTQATASCKSAALHMQPSEKTAGQFGCVHRTKWHARMVSP